MLFGFFTYKISDVFLTYLPNDKLHIDRFSQVLFLLHCASKNRNNILMSFNPQRNKTYLLHYSINWGFVYFILGS